MTRLRGAAREGWARLARFKTASRLLSRGGELPLRVGVERGMVATLSVAAPLLLLLSLPGFAADVRAESPLRVASLCLAAAMVGAVSVALLRRGAPSYVWLHGAAIAYLGLVVLELFQSRTPLPTDSTPWLIILSCIAVSCVAIGTLRPVRAGIICCAIVAAFIVAYAGRTPLGNLVVEAMGLVALAAGLIAGVTALRIRADDADSAEHQARELFESSRHQVALEEEKVRTDALLHDTVLAALSAAAAGRDAPAHTLAMARTALEIVSDNAEPPTPGPPTMTFERAVAAAEHELAPMRDLFDFDLTESSAVELPSDVAEALVASMLQALSNSVKHAGPSAVRSARATSTPDGGLRVVVRDDGPGFDLAQVPAERLGIRTSILERVRLVGATADIRSAPGGGTTVQLEWRPCGDASETSILSGVHG